MQIDHGVTAAVVTGGASGSGRASAHALASAGAKFPKRLGKPEEFGALVLELVRTTDVDGQNIRLDGAIRMPPR